MKRSVLPITFALMLGYGWGSVRAESEYVLMDAAPFFRDVSAANPGLETIMPLFVYGDTWSGNVPVSYTMRFRVFPAGKTTVLYTSAGRTFTPPHPCTTPTITWYDTKEQYVALPSSTWTHFVRQDNVSCKEASDGAVKEASVVYVYSADLAAAGGMVWFKKFDARWLDAFQGVDSNGDGTLDALMLVMPYANATGGYNEQLVILNPTTGAVISTASYEVVR